MDIALEDLQDVSTTNDIQNYSTSGPSSVLGHECGITTSTTTFISSCSTPNGGGGEEKSNEAGNYEAPVTIGTPNGSAGMMNGGGFPSVSQWCLHQLLWGGGGGGGGGGKEFTLRELVEGR